VATDATDATTATERPIQLVLRDPDLRRSRLTVFFRLFLAIPVFVWLGLRGIAAYFAAFVMWLAVLIEGKAPESIHDFIAGYVRYAAQVGAYILLAADPYPWFRVQREYPVQVEIAPPERQSRWTGFFRLFLAIPALILMTSLGGGFAFGPSGGSYGSQSSGGVEAYSAFSVLGVAAAAAFLTWFVAVIRGRAPSGLRDLVTFVLGYNAQAVGYLLLLTPRYPSSDPARLDPLPELPEHPLKLEVTDDLERSRVTVFFRLFLALPHFVWFFLWSIAVVFAVLAAWIVALVTGRVPLGLHRFLAAYVRYRVHLFSYVGLVGGKFPGFTGKQGSYGIDLEVAGPERQHRLKTLFRLFLAVPAFILSSAFEGVVFVVAFLGWWYALFKGRMPEGLRNLGASCQRYSAQATGYALLLTDRYPYASPVLRGREPVVEEPAAPVLGDAF
jgi:hypothetical protein